MTRPALALVTSEPTDNLAIALKVITPGDWLAQVDANVHTTVRALMARRRFTEAAECLLAHLTKTEVTRTREHGPGPTWDVAVDAFNAAVDRQGPEQMAVITRFVVGSVNATPPLLLTQGTGDEGRPTTSAAPTAGSCAPDAPTLTPVAGPECGHVDALTGLSCLNDEHPRNPAAHYFRSPAAAADLDRQED